ncbi:MAG: hypothetical protein ACOY46_09170 [Bacillota bacterium]
MKKRSGIITAPCETCLRKSKMDCFHSAAMQKTARSMEIDLYNHGVENIVSNLTLTCINYINENDSLKKQYRKIV